MDRGDEIEGRGTKNEGGERIDRKVVQDMMIYPGALLVGK